MSDPLTSILGGKAERNITRPMRTRMLDAVNRSMQSPLTRNGYALVASAAVTSALGVVFWVIAAHVIVPSELGIGAVLISTMLTISSASQLNFGNLLNRFLPTAGGGRLKLVGFAYAAAGLAAALVSSIFLFIADRVLPEIEGAIGTPWIGMLFVFGTVVWTIFALQDSALAGIRQAVWVPLENTIYSAAKIVILLVIANVGLDGIGLFSAWTLPLVPIVIVVNLYILRYLLPTHRQVEMKGDNPLAWDALLRFFRWDYLGGLMITVAMGVAPILVLSVCGPEASASYHLSWTITYSLYLVGRSMGISLLTESMVRRERLAALSAAAIVQTMLPLGVAAVTIALGAPLVMSLFGAHYAADASTLLSLLALSSIPWGFVTIFIAIARVQAWMAAIVVSQAATLILVLSLAALLMPHFGVTGMGLAWLLAHSAAAAGIGAYCLFRFGPESAAALLLQMASALAQFVEPFIPRGARCNTTILGHAALDDALGGIPHDTWQLGRIESSQSDTTVTALTALDPVTGTLQRVAMAKLATSERGRASLLRGVGTLDRLGHDGRFAELGFALPKILGTTVGGGLLLVVEAALPGRDGRSTSRGQDGHQQTFELTADALASLHRCTAVPIRIGEAWIADWISRPIQTLRAGTGALLTRRRREQALDLLEDQQRAFWLDRPWTLGLAHGDLSPGNLIFASSGERATERSAPFALSGIVDWGEAREGAPLGLDACHFLLTTRVLECNQELGIIVRELLVPAPWQAAETAFLDRATDGLVDWADPSISAALVAFTWLQHTSCNLQKADRYTTSYLWQTANVNWVLRGLLLEPKRR